MDNGEVAPVGPDETPKERLVEGPDGEQIITHEIGRRTYIVAQVDPLDVDGVRTVAVGAILWLVGFVLLLPFYDSLRESDRTWWLWTCLAGFGLGLIGLDYCRRRRNRRRTGGHVH